MLPTGLELLLALMCDQVLQSSGKGTTPKAAAHFTVKAKFFSINSSAYSRRGRLRVLGRGRVLVVLKLHGGKFIKCSEVFFKKKKKREINYRTLVGSSENSTKS